MKTLLVTSLVLFFIGCEHSNDVVVDTVITKHGNASLLFDKSTAPLNVKIIAASLSRSGYTTIERAINLLTDSSASILFDQVPVGVWKITIDAKNQSEQIVYTGQTNVEIIENTMSQINLVLKPVVTGVGSVQIFVSWGESTGTWKDYQNGPVFKKSASPIDVGGVTQPQIIKIQEKYLMYYGALTNISRVCLAQSLDGIIWTKYGSNPVIDIGASGRWDDGSVSTGPVIKIDSLYYMYYQGFSYSTGQHSVGYAVSDDGLAWKRTNDNRILVDNNYVYHASSVIKKDNKYLLYYDGVDPSTGLRAIFAASSVNGVHWTKVQDQPVLKRTFNWEINGVTFSTIIFENGKYRTVFADNGYNTCNFGTATSMDGIVWEKDDLPIFDYKKTSNLWGAGGVVYPFLSMVGNQKRIYYVGISDVTGERKIGFAYYQ